MKILLKTLTKSIAIVFLFINVCYSQGQNDVTLIVNKPPLNQLKVRDLWNIKMKNNTTNTITVYLFGTLTESIDGIVCTGTTAQITLQPNVLRNITTNELEPISYTYPCSNQKYKNALMSTGGAPDGEYDICVVAKAVGTNIEVGSGCQNTVIQKISPPELITPTDGEVLIQQNTVFTWLHSPPTGVSVKYKIKIVEVIGSQTPEAAMQSNSAFYQAENLTLKIHNYPTAAPKFVNNKKYAWQVFVISDGQTAASSEIWDFTFNSNNQPDPPIVNNEDDEEDCQLNVQASDITNLTPSTKTYNVGDTLTVGLFKMRVISVTKTDGKLNGKGSILVRWMKTPISVLFSNVKVNTDNRIYEGSVVSEIDETDNNQWPKSLVLNAIGEFSWTHTAVKAVDNFIHNVGGKLVKDLDLDAQVRTKTFNPLKLPLGFSFANNDKVTIAITEMRFDPTSAKMTCVTSVAVDYDILNDTISLGATNILFSKKNPNIATGKLGLIDDMVISENPGSPSSWELQFNKVNNNSQDGTYVEWGCEGFKQLSVDMDIKIPRNFLLPKNYKENETDKAKINFHTIIKDFSDWVVAATLDTCIIPNTNGFMIAMDSLYYDHSDTRNPNNINYPNPNIFDENRDNLFREIYIPNARLILPDKFRTFSNPNQKVTITAKDIIINKNGLYCDIKGENIIQLSSGNISGLGASVDTVKIAIKRTSIVNAYIRGKILLPICKDTSTNNNALNYKVNFNTDGSFLFSLKPSGDIIKASFFHDAKLTIHQSSYMNLTLDSLDKFDFKLNGNLGWDDQEIAGIKVKIGLDFQNFGMNYDESRTNDEFKFITGNWSFASPPKWLANFPISIKDVKTEKRDKGEGEFYRGGLSLKLELALDQYKIGVSTKLAFVGAIGKGDKIFMPNFVNVQLDSILIKEDCAAVKMDGYLVFYHGDQTFGDGFGGGIKATFKSIQIEAEVDCKFGIKPMSVGSSNHFRYWFVRGKVIVPKPGIIFMSGLAFYGFGAGAWKNMQIKDSTRTFTASDVSKSTEITKSKNGSGFDLIPVAPVNGQSTWGFTVMAVIGASPDPKTFNADATLKAEFNNIGGLNFISFDLGLWCMADLLERSNAPIIGNAHIEYNPPDKYFELSANITLSTALVKISENDPANLTFVIDGKNDTWKFTLGTPDKPNNIEIIGITFWEYFMFGKDFPPPTDWHPMTQAGFNQMKVKAQTNITLTSFSNSKLDDNSVRTGRGFALGVGAYYVKPEYDIDCWVGWAHLNITGGIEVDFSIMKYLYGSRHKKYRFSWSPPYIIEEDGELCGSNGQIGINNWYCKANLAAWGMINVAGSNSVLGRCDIITIGAYASCASGFPNPWWFRGNAGIFFTIFGTHWSCDADISLGDRCDPQLAPEDSISNDIITYEQEDAVEENSILIRSVNPVTNTGPTGSPSYLNPDIGMLVAFGINPDEIIEVEEQQSNGTTKTRRFKAIYDITLDSLGKAANNFLIWEDPNKNKNHTQGVSNKIVNLQKKRNTSNFLTLKRSTNMNQMGEYEYRVDRGPATQYQIGTPLNFADSSRYRFTVKGTLYEQIDSVTWVTVKNKRGRTVTQVVQRLFNTGKKITNINTTQQQLPTIIGGPNINNNNPIGIPTNRKKVKVNPNRNNN